MLLWVVKTYCCLLLNWKLMRKELFKRHEERVIIISSKDSDNKLTDAENALQQIATLILKEDESSTEAKVAAGHVAANTIRLLIAGTQAGCLIGISGQNIEKLRDSCGAIITILAQNQLPLCASAHESDRVVQISGDVPAVLKALEEIGSQLRENPPRQVISISPVYNITSIRPPQPYLDPTSADYVTFEMMISESLVGGLIGRSGTNISRIRNESGAMIKVYGGKGETKHRQIQFGGSAQQFAALMRMEHQDLLTPMFNSHILSSVPGRSQFTFAAANAVSDFETTVLYNDNVLYGLLQERVEYQDLFIPKLRWCIGILCVCCEDINQSRLV
ncbi:kh domain-containing protein hen4 [Quercus suber]|uniref:Kh domain-containing protein hen4 n=1 Tax=Quercus suber TaxID=58331 RepID=A0AAW0M447_QUESU